MNPAKRGDAEQKKWSEQQAIPRRREQVGWSMRNSRKKFLGAFFLVAMLASTAVVSEEKPALARASGPILQPEPGHKAEAGIGLDEITPVGRLVVLGSAFRAHGKGFHQGLHPVEEEPLDDGKAQPEQVAVEERPINYPDNAFVFNLLFFPNAILGSVGGVAGISLVEYHRTIGDYVSVSAYPEFQWIGLERREHDDFINGTGWGFQVAARVFPEGRRLRGLYAGLAVGYAWVDIRGGSGNGPSAGIECGYSIPFSSGFMMFVGVVVDYRRIVWRNAGAEHVINSIGPRSVFSLGYGW